MVGEAIDGDRSLAGRGEEGEGDEALAVEHADLGEGAGDASALVNLVEGEVDAQEAGLEEALDAAIAPVRVPREAAQRARSPRGRAGRGASIAEDRAATVPAAARRAARPRSPPRRRASAPVQPRRVARRGGCRGGRRAEGTPRRSRRARRARWPRRAGARAATRGPRRDARRGARRGATSAPSAARRRVGGTKGP